MRKIGFIVLALVLALGVLGAGFALWSEPLTIEGIVNTGEVDVGLSQVSNDPGVKNLNDPSEIGIWDAMPSTSADWHSTRYTQNVASTDCTLSDSDPDSDGDETINITVDNGYPCYYGSIAFDIDNLGSIPVKILSMKVTKVSFDPTPAAPNSGDEEMEVVDIDITDKDTVVIFHGGAGALRAEKRAAVATDEMSIYLSGVTLKQKIENDAKAWGAVTVHVEQGAAESASYDFTIKIVCAQWNEVN